MTLQEFGPMFGLLAVQLRATDADEVTIRAYYEGLKDLEPEFIGEAAKRLARAVNAAGESWFPRVGEWRREVASVEHEKREAQQAFLRKLPTPLCLACNDTSWARGEDNRVRPCSCRQFRRLELLGRRPWPALTAGDPTVVERVPLALVPREMPS